MGGKYSSAIWSSSSRKSLGSYPWLRKRSTTSKSARAWRGRKSSSLSSARGRSRAQRNRLTRSTSTSLYTRSGAYPAPKPRVTAPLPPQTSSRRGAFLGSNWKM